MYAKLKNGHIFTQVTKSYSEDGRVRVSIEPTFRGSPVITAQMLMKAHSPSGALAIVDRMGSVGLDNFWQQTRNYIANRLAGKSRKTRPVYVRV